MLLLLIFHLKKLLLDRFSIANLKSFDCFIGYARKSTSPILYVWRCYKNGELPANYPMFNPGSLFCSFSVDSNYVVVVCDPDNEQVKYSGLESCKFDLSDPDSMVDLEAYVVEFCDALKKALK